MTAKEKAKELIEKYKKFMYPFHDDVAKKQAKEAVMILVDEIIATEPRYPSNIDWDDVGATHQYFYEAQREEAEAFWVSVKSELNAL